MRSWLDSKQVFIRKQNSVLMRTILLFLIPLVLFLQPAGAADLQLKWTDLSGTVLDHDTQLVLPDGTVLRGIVVAVRDDVLILNVRRTSNAKAWPRGQASIPRASVSVLNIRRTRGAAGRTIGTVVGGVGGLGASIAILASHWDLSTGGSVGILVGMTAGLATVGYFVGSSIDQRLTVIHITP